MKVTLRNAYEIRLDEAVANLLDHGAELAAQRLLDQAYVTVPALLAQFPHIGRNFLDRNPSTPSVQAAWDQACVLLGNDIELREYVFEDYLVLYAVHGTQIELLTLRHHRQAGFLLPEA